MSKEQEAIERLRADKGNHPLANGVSTVSTADLRALLASHERMRLALETVSDSLSDNIWKICEALEGKNE